MRVRLITFLALALAGTAASVSCSGVSDSRAAEEVPMVGGAHAGPRFVLDLRPGTQYRKEMRVLGIGYTVRPQVAAWVESKDGVFLGTLYATEAAATGRYAAAPQTGRPEALPVWSALRASKKDIDAVSSPTVQEKPINYGASLASRLRPGTYYIFLEINRSYDWNGTYTKKNSGVNGQPSLVYRAALEVGGGRREASFEPIGTGSIDGTDGAIRPGLAGIDTALDLFSSLRVSYEEN